jgi:hypothetical protein
MYVWLRSQRSRVLNNEARWQNVLFNKCRHHYAAFRSTSNTDYENIEIIKYVERLIFFIVVV